jgi:hypothetical protein
MLLVGVIKIGEDKDLAAGRDVCFILQNFWQKKQFISVRRDYFRGSVLGDECPSIHWVTSNPPTFADPETVYASPVLLNRVSYSLHLLEKPLRRATPPMIKWASVPNTY